ncbi:MAG: hypothetical protein FWC66_05245 [Oscillospiraceae bacterium]|nr:hypothetical protein [Oscillospiraceae bacterium]
MKEQKISILGSEYRIIETTETDCVELKNAHGYCSYLDKQIYVETEMFPDEQSSLSIDEIRAAQSRLTMRHELIHAFIFESGLSRSPIDTEHNVHWIATQFPKMLEAFKAVGAL